MRFLTNLNKIESETVQKIVKAQKRYLEEIAAKLNSGRTLTPKTLEWKLKTAKKRTKLLREDFKKYYKGAFDETLNTFLKEGAEQVNTKVNFDAVPWDRFKTLEDTGLEFMYNYSDDMYKKVKSQLYVSMLNGESMTDAWKRIKPIGNERARPKVMVRDQMSRTAQTAIESSYKASGHPQDYDYYWTGPSDKRTTDICETRKAGNPYSYEEMKSLDSHPHIQCRHRWVAKLHQGVKRESTAEIPKEKWDKKLSNLSDADRENIYDAYDFLDERSKRMVSKYYDDVKFISNKNESGYYDPFEGVINISDGSISTIQHELGHMVDYNHGRRVLMKKFDDLPASQEMNLKFSTLQRIEDKTDVPFSINRDFEYKITDLRTYYKKNPDKAKDLIDDYTMAVRELKDKFKKDPFIQDAADKLAKKEFNNVSDIINGITEQVNGKAAGSYLRGIHSTNYWYSDRTNVHQETFAELFAIQNKGNPEAREASLKFLNKHFGNLTSLFDDLMNM